jgi:hypothetical protein
MREAEREVSLHIDLDEAGAYIAGSNLSAFSVLMHLFEKR